MKLKLKTILGFVLLFTALAPARLFAASSDNIAIKVTVVQKDPPPAPNFDPVESPTDQNYQRISGTKSESVVSISASCSTAQVGTVTYPSSTTWTCLISQLSPGENKITAVAYDELGLASQPAQTTIIFEQLALAIEITTPKEGQIINKNTVDVEGNVTRDNVQVFVNSIQAAVSGKKFIADNICLKEGSNTIYAQAVEQKSRLAVYDEINLDLIYTIMPEYAIDDFDDTIASSNSLGYYTSDDGSCYENKDVSGAHKISWQNTNAYWYTNLWDSQTNTQGTDTTGYGLLVFKIKGTNGGETFNIELEDTYHGADYNRQVDITDYINITTSWQAAAIPLHDFAAQGVLKTQLRSLVFHFNQTNSGTIFIDDVMLIPDVVDNFIDTNLGENNLGFTTGDDSTLATNLDIDGYHQCSWNNSTDYWYSDLGNENFSFDASGYKYLVLRIKGGTGNENISLGLKDSQSTKIVGLFDYGDIKTSWNTIQIPLSAFTDLGLDISQLKKLYFYFTGSSSGTVYIDEIYFSITNSESLVKPVSTGLVKITNNHLYVNNELFFTKGVGYQPTPIGTEPKANSELYQNLNIANRDFPNLRYMGCNVIRTWKTMNSPEFLDTCYNNGVEPIYVALGFDIDPDQDLSNTSVRNQIKTSFTSYVNTYKNKPALLFWVLGNELNQDYEGNLVDWYTLANELAQIAYQQEGASYHPVAIVNRDLEHIGREDLFSNDDSLTYIDIWGINAYRQNSFGGFFDSYAQLSSKPLWVSEYGIDSWYTLDPNLPSQGYEYEDTQANYLANYWDEIEQAIDYSIGATLFNFSDEWWKVEGGNHSKQEYGGYIYRMDQPDEFANEEFWGIFKIQDNGSELDILTPKSALDTMRRKFLGLPPPEDTSAPEDVTDFTATAGNQKVVLNWTASLNSEADLVGYKLYIDSGSGYGSPIVLDADKISYEAVNLTNDQQYTFKLTAFDEVPNESAGVTVSVMPKDITAPEDITNLEANPSNTKVLLSWTTSKNSEGDLSGHKLYIDSGSDYGSPTQLPSDTTSYQVTGLTNNKTYTFKIAVFDEAQNESQGVVIQAMPIAAPQVVITSPQNGSVTDTSAITVSGTVDNGATVKVNGINATVASGLFSASNISLTNEGANTITATATFDDINFSQDEITVYKDTSSPEVEITSPHSGAEVIGY